MPITFHDISSQIHTYQKQCRLPLTFQCHLYNSNIVVLFDSNCRGGFCSNPCKLIVSLGSQALKVLVFKRRGRSGFSPFGLDTLVPHRQEMRPTHGL